MTTKRERTAMQEATTKSTETLPVKDTNNTKWLLKKCEEVISSLPDTSTEDPDIQSPEANLAIQVFITETPALLLTLVLNNPSPNKSLKGSIQKYSKQYCGKVVDLLSTHSLLPPSTLCDLLRSLSSHTKSDQQQQQQQQQQQEQQKLNQNSSNTNITSTKRSNSAKEPLSKKRKNSIEASIIWNEFPMLRKKLATTLIGIWKEGDNEARILSLLAIRMHCSKWSSIHDLCAKDMYTAYLEVTKKLSTHTFQQASLLLRGLVEIFSLNMAGRLSPSITALSLRFLKRLAHTLQNSIRSGSGHSSLSSMDKKKTGHNRSIQTSSIGDLLSWSFVSAIRFWSKLLEKIDGGGGSGGAFFSKNPSPLMGPFCGILGGSLSFQANNPRYFPFHLHCVMAAMDLRTVKVPGMWECLLRIASQIARVPLYRLGAGAAGVMKTKAMPGSAAGTFDLASMIKVTKTDSTSLPYLESVLDEVFYLIFVQLSKEDVLLLPEVVEPIIGLLKKLSIGDRKIKQQIDGHLSLCISAQKDAIKQRGGVGASSSVSPSSYLCRNQQHMKTCAIIEKYIASLNHVRQMRKESLPDLKAQDSDFEQEDDDDDGEEDHSDNSEDGEEIDFSDGTHDDVDEEDDDDDDVEEEDDKISTTKDSSNESSNDEDILLEEDDEDF